MVSWTPRRRFQSRMEGRPTLNPRVAQRFGPGALRASRSRRRDDRRASLAGVFPDADVDAALDALALMDFAWHDCYGDSCPPQSVIDDVVVVASGDLSRLVRAAHLGVMDFRDVRVAAHEIRRTTG